MVSTVNAYPSVAFMFFINTVVFMTNVVSHVMNNV